jgi:hypothetical protein
MLNKNNVNYTESGAEVCMRYRECEDAPFTTNNEDSPKGAVTWPYI